MVKSGLSLHLTVGVLCAFLLVYHGGAAPVSKRVFELPPDFAINENFDSERAISLFNFPLAVGFRWTQLQTIDGEPAAVFLEGYDKVLRVDATGVLPKSRQAGLPRETSWFPQNFAACADALIGFDPNYPKISLFEDDLCANSGWTEAQSENGLLTVNLNVADSMSPQLCSLAACIGEKLFVGTTDVGTPDDGLFYLQHVDVATGEVVSFQDPATEERIPFACNTNLGDAGAVVGGKVIFASCCVVNALDPETLEVREVVQHCDCTSLPVIAFQDGPGPCDIYNDFACPVPTMRARVSGGFLMGGYQSSNYAVTVGDDGWPTAVEVSWPTEEELPGVAEWALPNNFAMETTVGDAFFAATTVDSRCAGSSACQQHIVTWSASNPAHVTAVYTPPQRTAAFWISALAASTDVLYFAASNASERSEVLLFRMPTDGSSSTAEQFASVSMQLSSSRQVAEVLHLFLLPGLDSLVAVVGVLDTGCDECQPSRRNDRVKVQAVSVLLATGAATVLDTLCEGDTCRPDDYEYPRKWEFASLDNALLYLKHADNETIEMRSIVDEAAPAIPFSSFPCQPEPAPAPQTTPTPQNPGGNPAPETPDTTPAPPPPPQPPTFKVQATSTLVGMSAASFDNETEAAFLAGVADLLPGRNASDVSITSKEEAADRLFVVYEVGGFPTQAEAEAAGDTIFTSQGELLTALQTTGMFTNLTGVSTTGISTSQVDVNEEVQDDITLGTTPDAADSGASARARVWGSSPALVALVLLAAATPALLHLPS